MLPVSGGHSNLFVKKPDFSPENSKKANSKITKIIGVIHPENEKFSPNTADEKA